MQKPTPPKFKVDFFWIILIVGFFYAWFLYYAKKKQKQLTKRYKRELIAPYKVDKKTFSKWVVEFCSDIIPLEEYKVSRKLSEWDISLIKERLGDPNGRVGVMNKKQIAHIAGSDYETVREMVLSNLDAAGLTMGQYDSMNTFPPSIVEKIAILLGDPEEFFEKASKSM